MAYLKTFSGSILLRIENDQIKDFSSGMIKYKVNGNRITDFYGRILFLLDGENVKDFSGRILLKITYKEVKDFYGRIIATFDSSNIKDFSSGQIQYKIDGFLSRRELMALLAIMYAN